MGSCSPSTSVNLVVRSGAKSEIELLRDKIEKDSDNGTLPQVKHYLKWYNLTLQRGKF